MNKIILITSATSGFGEACARKFAAAGGYDIIITGRRKERLEALLFYFLDTIPNY